MQIRLIERNVTDAETSEVKLMRLKPDQHGCVLELEGCAESLVIDLSGGTLRVYVADENGELPSTPSARLIPTSTWPNIVDSNE